MIGYKLIEVRTTAVLTTSYVQDIVIGTSPTDDNDFNIIYGLNQAVLLVNPTLGSADSIDIEVAFSDDKTTWYIDSFAQLDFTNFVTKVYPGPYRVFSDTPVRIPIPIKDRYVRIRSKAVTDATGSDLLVKIVFGNNI